jgi:hypothetical protein
LSDYATTASLSDYATTASLSDYATNTALSSYTLKTTVDASLALYSTKTIIDASLALYSTKTIIDASLALYSTKTFIDASLALYSTKTIIDASLALYSTKTIIDASLALYSTKTIIDASLANYALTSSLSTYATNAALSSYTLKTAVDASLANYSTISYVDGRFTTLTGVAPSQLDTLAEIASALQGDASFGTVIYGRINSCDSSINTIRTSLADYTLKTTVDASLANYSTKAIIDASLVNYALTSSLSSYTLKTTVDASLAFYSTKSIIDTSLNLYLRGGQTSDALLNGNVQLGDGSRSMGINKIPNTLYALDISGNFDVNGDSFLGIGTSRVGINTQTPTVALDISGSTNMSGNLSLTKAASITMGSFDLSSVNMSIFNVSEKFTNVALNGGVPTLDYSRGGIFYISDVNSALSIINITNVPTTLNRSISVTLILAQTGGAGTNCFTTGTLNVNGSAITYLKPDATALAAPSASRSVIINQFIIIWAGAIPTVIAYLSSMG